MNESAITRLAMSFSRMRSMTETGLAAVFHAIVHRFARTGQVESATVMPGDRYRRLLAGLDHAPISQRGLAFWLALMVLSALLGGGWSGQQMALQFGLGLALIGLPAAFGWSDFLLRRAASLAACCGLLAMIAIMSTFTVQPDTAQAWRTAIVIFLIFVVAIGPVMVKLFPVWSRQLGPVLFREWLGSAVFSGVALLMIGASQWPEWSGNNQALAIAALYLTGVMIVAFALNRLEAIVHYRHAARLLQLRSTLSQLLAIPFGTLIGWLAISDFQERATKQLFNTPLEGMAPTLGAMVGFSLALGVALVVMYTPRLAARWQLAGRLTASGSGEAIWGIVITVGTGPVLWLANVFVNEYSGQSFDFTGIPTIPAGLRFEGNAVIAAAIALLCYSGLRLLMARPTAVYETALWIVFPDASPRPACRIVAELASRTWEGGPVNLLAPTQSATALRGTHFQLARRARALPLLFSSQIPVTQFGESGSALGRAALPTREHYCKGQAAQQTLRSLPAAARILVVRDGDAVKDWENALADLPAQATIWTSATLPSAAPNHRAQTVNFANRSDRNAEWEAYLVAERLRAQSDRDVLIIFGESDRDAAEQLSRLLDGVQDANGQRLRVSPYIPFTPDSASTPFSNKIWRALMTLMIRPPEDGKRHALSWLKRQFWTYLFSAGGTGTLRIPELIVFEAGFDAIQLKSMRQLSRSGDDAIALMPGSFRDMSTLLLDPAAYRGGIRLPPPDAVMGALPLIARRIIDKAPMEPLLLNVTPFSAISGSDSTEDKQRISGKTSDSAPDEIELDFSDGGITKNVHQEGNGNAGRFKTPKREMGPLVSISPAPPRPFGEFDYCAYFSYAQADDDAWNQWISCFKDELEYSLPSRIRGGGMPPIYMGGSIQAIGNLNDEIRNRLGQSFSLFLFVHDHCVGSEWVLNEVANFKSLCGEVAFRERLYIVAMSERAIQKMTSLEAWHVLFPNNDQVWIPFFQEAEPERPKPIYSGGDTTIDGSRRIISNDFWEQFVGIREDLARKINTSVANARKYGSALPLEDAGTLRG